MQKLSKKQAVLFDLDGTVTNSKEGIFNSIYYVFEKLNMSEDNPEILEQFIGPSIGSSFRRIYHMNDQEADYATEIYREYYREKGIHEFSIYDGMEALLIKLKQQGKKIGLATKKPEPFAIEMMQEANLTPYFDYICGSSLSETNEDKSHIILRCAAKLSDGNLDTVVHVGDTKYDVIGANDVGIDCIGVLYGFGSEKELVENKAIAIAKDMDELTQILTV